MKAKLSEFDTALYFVLFKPERCEVVRQLALWLSKSGNGGMYVIVSGCMWYWFPEPGRWLFLTALLGFAIERPIYFVCKRYIGRIRPCDYLHQVAFLTPSDKFSLPSGHSAGAFLFATVWATTYPQWSWCFYLWATGVAVSRVVVGVHYPLDIIAGAGLGILCAELAVVVQDTL
ncbi:phosphatase PAP2 family protein [Pseudoalteromonas fenneropenaei]|uniref:undecaprenyl-diphosphate phosphatase n=1 Tax=Pseudoalteromonas fenneropenaei TaxID=1737459 RepID=A0ABV7CK13_9GAMM